jgi:SAM-dependent methyltransferase
VSLGLRRRMAIAVRRLCNSKGVIDASNRFSRAQLSEWLERELTALDAEPGKPRVLNVGAGGPLAARVSRLRHARVVHVDVDPARAPDVVADVQDLGCFPDASFDAVLLLEVLEHVPAPDAALSEVHRVLAPGGRVLLSTPFLLEIHEAPHDFYRFTEYGLRHLLRGFEQVRVVRRNGALIASLVPLIRLTRSRFLRDALVGLAALGVALLLSPLLFRVDRALRSDAATTGYVASARR